MKRIERHSSDLAELPQVLHDLKGMLKYHTESGFSAEEADGYAQQLDDIESILVPMWQERLGGTPCDVEVVCTPRLGGFLKIRVSRDQAPAVEVFAESYGHFNAEMCDGSCYQYVYQKVLCYRDALESGRVVV